MKKSLFILLCVTLLCFTVSCKEERQTLGEYGGDDSSTVSEVDVDTSVVLTAPNGELAGKVKIYRPDSDYMHLEYTELEFKGDALALVAEMVKNGGLIDGCSADEFYIDGDVLYINMNKAYEDYVRAGSTAEYFGVGSLVNTLIANYSDVGVKKVKITVEGRGLNSHGGISEGPLGMFE